MIRKNWLSVILLLFIEMRYNLDQRWQVTHIYKEVIDSWVVWAWVEVVIRAVVRMMIQLYATCVLHPAQFWSRRWCLRKKGKWLYHYVKGSKVLLAVPKNPIWKISLLFWTIFRRFVNQYVLTHWRKRLESNWWIRNHLNASSLRKSHDQVVIGSSTVDVSKHFQLDEVTAVLAFWR